VVAVIGAVVATLLGLALIATLYEAPSCTDQKQNQDESGVDCGGSCAYLCTASLAVPIVSLQRALVQVPNRVDVIAYVENPNADAFARDVTYDVTLYATDRTVLKRGTVIIDIPPGVRVPIYLPGFFPGKGEGTQAFLTLDASTLRWSRALTKPVVFKVATPVLAASADAPRVTADIANPTLDTFRRVTTIVVVYDTVRNVIAASQTVIPELPALGEVLTTFTWTRAFTGTPSTIEVTPLVPLTP
jgi:hypothetical protein